MTLNRTADNPACSVAAFFNSEATTREPPFVSTVLPSRTKLLPNAAMRSRLSFARRMNSRPLVSRCVRIALKSPASPRWPGLCKVVMRYLWNKSVPADSPMGFGIDFFRCAVDFSRRSRVSDIVDDGECVRRRTNASIAAMGMVKSASEPSNPLYVATMLYRSNWLAGSSILAFSFRMWKETYSNGLVASGEDSIFTLFPISSVSHMLVQFEVKRSKFLFFFFFFFLGLTFDSALFALFVVGPLLFRLPHPGR